MKWIFLLLMLCIPIAVASDLPDLGDASQGSLSPVDENKLGRQIMQEIRHEPDYDDDAELTDYLNTLGYRLVANSDENQLKFTFFAIQDSTFNAFSLPGGYVGVHTGLIEATENESELAGVLGHEIAHVTQHHMARMIENQSKGILPSLGMLALAILAARADPQVSGGALAATQGVLLQKQLDFSRDNEREADRIGMETMRRAGFDPRGMVSFFQRLQHYDRLDDGTLAYLRTHPLTTERIADMQNRVAQLAPVKVGDSIEYGLVRAKLRVLDLPPETAVSVMRKEIQDGENTLAEHFGLALALLRARQFAQAEAEYQALHAAPQKSPMIDMLGAQIKQSAGDAPMALQRYQDAWQRFPNYTPLAEQYSEALLNAGQPAAALDILSQQIRSSGGDARLYQLESRCYTLQHKDFLRHYAQAKAYRDQDDLPQAIEQLQLALKTQDGDFYQMSEAEAQLSRWVKEQSIDKKK